MADDGLAVDPHRARPLDRLALATDGAGFDAAGAACLIAPDIRRLATHGEGQLAAEVDVRRGVQGVAEVYGDRIGHRYCRTADRCHADIGGLADDEGRPLLRAASLSAIGYTLRSVGLDEQRFDCGGRP